MTANAVSRQGVSAGVRISDDVEVAARCGYLDALSGKSFSHEYECATDKWQRNYEIGRLWVASMKSAGIAAPEWHEGDSRPVRFDMALAMMQAANGNVVPRSGERMPVEPNLDFGFRLRRRPS